jgi:hypothetical protein
MEKVYCAGAGKAEILLPSALFPTGEGFAAVHDPLYVRAFLLEGEMRVLFLVLDLTSLPAEEGVRLKKLATLWTGGRVDQVWVCVSHTFSAPHLCPAPFVRSEAERVANALLGQALEQAMEQAIREAVHTRPVRLMMKKTTCDVNVNRDVELPEGWWLGANASGYSNKTLTVIQAVDEDGRTIGGLVHYAVQSSIMDGSVRQEGGKLVSGDLAGFAVAQAEQALGVPMLFLVGAAGNQAPKEQAVSEKGDLHEEGLRLVENYGSILGKAILEAIEMPGTTIEGRLTGETFSITCQGQMMPDRLQLHPTRSYFYQPADGVETPITLLATDGVVLVGIQPELDCEVADQLQERVGNTCTVLVVTMVNGGAKYMASQDSYDRFTYEARNSMFARGSAEQLRDAVAQKMKQ